jgi:nucleoid-associated protein YejK
VFNFFGLALLVIPGYKASKKSWGSFAENCRVFISDHLKATLGQATHFAAFDHPSTNGRGDRTSLR